MRKYSVGWGVTSLCNMNCRFCYSKYKREGRDDLSLNDWIKFFEENREVIGNINFGTGENSLCDDWFHLIKVIRKSDERHRMAVTTNGYLYEAVKNEWRLKAFCEAIDEIDVSLDFADAAFHNQFRGQNNAYEWALNTLKLCEEYNKSATIVFIGCKDTLNKNNIDGLFEIADKYNAKLRMNIYRPTEGINNITSDYIAEYENFLEILYYISEKYKILAINDEFFSSILTDTRIKSNLRNAQETSIRILPNGNITPSTYLLDDEFVVGNICDTNVLLDDKVIRKLEYFLKKTLPVECDGCKYEDTCEGGVLDRRYLWYGSQFRKDPYCLDMPNEDIRKLDISVEDFESVHDGYLPTMFFKP